MDVHFVINHSAVYLYFVYFFLHVILYEKDLEKKCPRIAKAIFLNKRERYYKVLVIKRIGMGEDRQMNKWKRIKNHTLPPK